MDPRGRDDDDRRRKVAAAWPDPQRKADIGAAELAGSGRIELERSPRRS